MNGSPFPRRLRALLLLGLAALPLSGISDPGPAQLVEAERAFAVAVREHGIRQGFLEHLAEEGILFRPEPVPGRRWYASQAEQPGVLAWAPETVELAASGDLGWTTGPWEFRPASTAREPVATGHFVSVWRRGPAGDWKVVVDLGIDHGPLGPLPDEAVLLGGKRTRTPSGADRHRAHFSDLVATEGRFRRRSAERGDWPAITRVADRDFRLLRDGHAPFDRRSAGVAARTHGVARIRYPAPDQRIVVSAAGDLGYVWGEAVREPAAGGPAVGLGYVRIWRHHGGSGWRLVLDIALDYPPGRLPAPSRE